MKKILLAVLLAAVAVQAAPAQTYPDRPIKLLVPLAAASAVDIAARIVGYIRQAALGDALLPYSERVDHALQALLAHPPAGKPWTEPQRNWLKRIAAQTKANLLVDREALDDPDLLFKREGGGFTRLDKLFNGQLQPVLDAFNDALWVPPAQSA